METPEIITMAVSLILTGACALISVRSFMEKGFLFNNAFLWASAEERQKMNKKPYYRQTAIVFCLLGLAFAVTAVSVALRNTQIELPVIPLLAGTVIYAVVSSLHIEKNKRK